MSATKNLLLVGATGTIGKYILESVLTLRPHLDRLAVLTSARTVETKSSLISSLRSQKVEIFTGDITNEADVKAACAGIDTVISSVGRAVIIEQVNLLRWAAESGVHRFYPSEFGTDIKYGPASAHEVPNQAKLKVRAALEASGLEYTYVVVGPYPEGVFSYNMGAEFGSFNVKEKKAVLLGDGEGRISFTAMPDVGKLVVAALLHPEQSKNRALKVNSFTTTWHEIAKEFEKQTGSKWTVEYTPLDQLRVLEKQAYEKDDPRAVGISLRRIWAEGGTLYDKTDNDLIEAPPMETLEIQVRKAIEAQS